MMTRALHKTPECFKQLIPENLEFAYDPDRAVIVVNWSGQPVLFCFPPLPVMKSPSQDGDGKWTIRLGVAGGSDAARALAAVDREVLRFLGSRGGPGAARYDKEGVLRRTREGGYYVEMSWLRGRATVKDHQDNLVEAGDLAPPEFGSAAAVEATAVLTHVSIEGGEARAHLRAWELKRILSGVGGSRSRRR